MTNKIQNFKFTEIGQYFIVIGGDAKPTEEISPEYFMDSFSDILVRSYRKNHADPNDKYNERNQGYLSLAKLEVMEGSLQETIDFPRMVEWFNNETAEAWAKEGERELNIPRDVRQRYHGMRFEKYFFAFVDNNNKLQGTSYLNPVYSGYDNGICATLAAAKFDHEKSQDLYASRHKEYGADGGFKREPFPDHFYQIRIVRIVVNWAHMIRPESASYRVYHEASDFEWNLGDEYDDLGNLTATDFRKTYPKNYRKIPADQVARMMINYEVTKATSHAIGDCIDRIRAEGRLAEDREEELLLAQHRAYKKRVQERNNKIINEAHETKNVNVEDKHVNEET